MSIRLINVKTLRLKPFNSQTAPPYAILSHTWVENEEVGFQEMCQIAENPEHPATKTSGYRKIKETCRQAMNHGLEHAWVDTCCIDKSSSAELSEAINSMFRWYRDATICFAYLSDYTFLGSNLMEDMKECQWFTRGWCLQELIAPKHLVFYDKMWTESGSKIDLVALINSITRIDENVLEDHEAMYSLPVARRMSWASSRVTTRIEDTAYCLLGLFDIHMPMLYGEGEKAFGRLQEEIIRRYDDTSIFLFAPKASALHSFFPPEEVGSRTSANSTGEKLVTLHSDNSEISAIGYLKELSSYGFCSMLASSPADFYACGDIVHKARSRIPFDRQAFTVTNRGVQLGRQTLQYNSEEHCFMWKTAFSHYRSPDDDTDGVIFLRKVGLNLFTRIELTSFPSPSNQRTGRLQEDVCVLLHLTPPICYQIRNTLKSVLRIEVQTPDGTTALFSEQAPKNVWDQSGNLFLFQKAPDTLMSFMGFVQITLKNQDSRTPFYLRFIIHDPPNGEAFVLLSEEPPVKWNFFTDVDGKDCLDVVFEAGLQDVSSHDHGYIGRLGIDAEIYREPGPADCQAYICSVLCCYSAPEGSS